MKLTQIFALAVAAGFVASSAQASPSKSSQDAPAADSHAAAADSPAPAESGHQVAAKDASQGSAKKKSGHGATWSYSGKAGPSNWGKLSKDYHACLQGASQSPIDIGGTGFDGASVEPIQFDYSLSPVEFINNGHTVQVNYAPGSSMTVAGKRYELLQFHFHTPSEHAVNRQRGAAEAHLVHKSADGELAVVGVMMQEGAENLALSEFWGLMPRKAGETKRDKRTLINARDLLPHNTNYYRYMGSLTTPPCSEGVNWYVMSEPVTIGAGQLQQFAEVIGDNARPLQAVNRRLVLAPKAGH